MAHGGNRTGILGPGSRNETQLSVEDEMKPDFERWFAFMDQVAAKHYSALLAEPVPVPSHGFSMDDLFSGLEAWLAEVSGSGAAGD